MHAQTLAGPCRLRNTSGGGSNAPCYFADPHHRDHCCLRLHHPTPLALSPDIDDYYRKKEPRPLIFCNFARGLADKTYDEVLDFQHMYKVLTEALLEYNETNAGRRAGGLLFSEGARQRIARYWRAELNNKALLRFAGACIQNLLIILKPLHN